MRVLLVEDEQRLATALAYVLNKRNIITDVAYDGVTGEEMAKHSIYDVIVLDRMLPGKEGVEILKSLRRKRIHTPVIFLTAKDEVASRVEGLDAGADDYLIKPFATDEFVSRVRALGRRCESRYIEEKMQIASLLFDPLQCEAVYSDKKVKFTLKEAQLLAYLLRNRGQVLSKEQIMDRVWGYDSEVEPNSVELYVYYLRKKLLPEECGVVIQTVRGVGYCLKEA